MTPLYFVIQLKFYYLVNWEKIEKLFFENGDLIIIVIKIFLPFITFDVTSPILHSIDSEDTVFDPGISISRAGCLFLCYPKDKWMRGESKLYDSIKNKRFVGGTPCLSNSSYFISIF